MKILTVFYSLTGNTKKLAEAINNAAGGQIMEIKTKKEFPKEGGKMYFALTLQMIFGGGIKILPPDKDPNDYDLIFLGGPVWAGKVAPPIKEFLKKAKLKNKKIALFCARGGDDPGESLINLEKELAGNEIIGKIDFKMDGVGDEILNKNLEAARGWVSELIKN